MRPITQGQPQGDLVVIEKGLKPGDRVILTGQLMVIPNAPVTVVNGEKPAQVAQGRQSQRWQRFHLHVHGRSSCHQPTAIV